MTVNCPIASGEMRGVCMKIDHIGYAVKKIERAKTSFEKLGYQFEDLIEDSDRNIAILFGEKDGYRIELVSPLDKGKESPVDSFLSKIGPTPYHICYRSDRFDDELEQLQKQGFKMTIPPAPAIAFGGKRVAFLMNLGLGLMEIVEE